MAVNPIQIVPLHGAALEAPAKAPSLTYRGGTLITAAQVFTFFWGAGWKQDPPAGLIAKLNGFFDYVLTSPLIDQLAEYSVQGKLIGHGARTGTLTVTSGPAAGSIADADVQLFIQQQLGANPSLPQPGPSSLYYVFLPPGVSITLDGGSSCSNFCGYHSDINGSLFYAVMPYPDCGGCSGGLSVLDALTSTSSHELCEAITDPVPGQGFYDDANGEIGDICAWKTKKLGAYTVQLEWSNSAGRCV
jgi:hypothetical protein